MKTSSYRICVWVVVFVFAIVGLFILWPKGSTIQESNLNSTKEGDGKGSRLDGMKMPDEVAHAQSFADGDPKDKSGDVDSRIEAEKRMKRKFTKDEIALKPPELPWLSFAYAVETHGNAVRANGIVQFYGRVTDVEGNSLDGVSLIGQVSWEEPSFVKAVGTGKESHTKDIKLITDTEGRFKIEGVVGRNLKLMYFDKEGYDIYGEKKYWGFSFNPQNSGRHRADPDNPVVFTMKKEF